MVNLGADIDKDRDGAEHQMTVLPHGALTDAAFDPSSSGPSDTTTGSLSLENTTAIDEQRAGKNQIRHLTVGRSACRGPPTESAPTPPTGPPSCRAS